jgi:hypothetical protein
METMKLKKVDVPIYKYEKEAFVKAIEISNDILQEKNPLYNWMVLKLFYLNLDLIMLKLLEDRVYFWKNKPLDMNKPKLKQSIIDEYKNWLKLDYEKKNKLSIQQKLDKRLYINNEYTVNKDTTDFQIRHSLYQILYELCGKDVNKCLKFLNDIKTKLTNDYYIQDFTKGIYYFEELQKQTNLDKDFQNYNDPDLAVEENYGQIEPHTKYRIKYYDFSTQNQTDQEGNLKILGYTLLFEIRNYGSLRQAIIKRNVNTTTIPKKQTTTTIPKKQTTTIPKKTISTPSTPDVPSWLKPK